MEDIPVCCLPCVLYYRERCSHPHTTLWGGFHFSHGEVWDDLREVCDLCGAVLSGSPCQAIASPEDDEIPF